MRIIINNFVRWLVLAIAALLLVACGSAPLTSTFPPIGDKPQASEPAAATPERRQARIGLALGGGAARGFAHVGVIQVLEEAGLHPHYVAGTSAGSLVAALYASGKSSQELRRVADTMEEAEITDWMVPLLNRGALRGGTFDGGPGGTGGTAPPSPGGSRWCWRATSWSHRVKACSRWPTAMWGSRPMVAPPGNWLAKCHATWPTSG